MSSHKLDFNSCIIMSSFANLVTFIAINKNVLRIRNLTISQRVATYVQMYNPSA